MKAPRGTTLFIDTRFEILPLSRPASRATGIIDRRQDACVQRVGNLCSSDDFPALEPVVTATVAFAFSEFDLYDCWLIFMPDSRRIYFPYHFTNCVSGGTRRSNVRRNVRPLVKKHFYIL